MRAGHILTKSKAKAIGKMLRLVRTIRQNGLVRRYSESQRPLLPIPPTTGYSHHERIGEAQFLYTVFNQLMGTDVEIIYAFPDGKTNPNPVPKKLYEPRLFFLPTPRGIPMPKPSTPSGNEIRNSKFEMGHATLTYGPNPNPKPSTPTPDTNSRADGDGYAEREYGRL